MGGRKVIKAYFDHTRLLEAVNPDMSKDLSNLGAIYIERDLAENPSKDHISKVLSDFATMHGRRLTSDQPIGTIFASDPRLGLPSYLKLGIVTQRLNSRPCTIVALVAHDTNLIDWESRFIGDIDGRYIPWLGLL